MKKNNIAAFSLALLVACGTLFAANQLSANEPNLDIKLYAQNTLQVLGIDADTDSITSSHSVKDSVTFTDKDGKEWVYIDFTDRTKFIEDMENYYDEEFVGTFIDVQADIMRKHSQAGNTIPVILLDKDLQEGTFSFTRSSGETLSFPIYYDSRKGWTYEEPALFESAQ